MTQLVPLSQLAEEIKAIMVERVKNAREEGLRMYFDIGETLRRYEKQGINITNAVEGLTSLMSDTSLWFAIKLYDNTEGNFEAVYSLGDGQNISVEKAKKRLGFRGKEKEDCERHNTIAVYQCITCRKIV